MFTQLLPNFGATASIVEVFEVCPLRVIRLVCARCHTYPPSLLSFIVTECRES